MNITVFGSTFHVASERDILSLCFALEILQALAQRGKAA